MRATQNTISAPTQVLENQVYSGSYDKTVNVWDISSLAV